MTPAMQKAADALRPFAEAMKRQDDYCKDVKAKPLTDDQIGPGVTMGDLRRADEALRALEAEAGGDIVTYECPNCGIHWTAELPQ